MKVRLCDLDLNALDRAYARRCYRIVRIAIYAPDGAQGDRFHGWHGMDRDTAKRFVSEFFTEVSWHMYLGSK